MLALARTTEIDCYTRAANEDFINGGLRTRTKYGYDLLDRLTSASESGTTLGWSYDPDGNRIQQTGATAATALSMAGTSFTFNGRGRMVSATAGTTTTSYVYSALGQMIEKNVGGTVTLLMYDEMGHLLGEYSSSGSLIQETVWIGNIPVATLRPNGGTVSIYFVHANQLGAPIMVTRSADNAVMWRWDTDPFGSVAPNQNPTGQGTFIYNLRFPGQYYQAETGLYYNTARDYDPFRGRYVESDPIGLKGGSYSTYAYARGNPVSKIDPRGLMCFSDLSAGEAGESAANVVLSNNPTLATIAAVGPFSPLALPDLPALPAIQGPVLGAALQIASGIITGVTELGEEAELAQQTLEQLDAEFTDIELSVPEVTGPELPWGP